MRFATTNAILFLAATIAPTSSLLAGARQSRPAKLESVVSDGFVADTRANYRLAGDVSWETGCVTLSEGASFERAVDGGAWAKLELAIELPEPPALHAELRVWFLLDGRPNCYVRLRRNPDSVGLVTSGERDGKNVVDVVREVETDLEGLSEVTLEYRYGLVLVQSRGKVLLGASIDNGDARVLATRAEAATSLVKLNRLRISVAPPPAREFTDEQKHELAEASALNRELVRLYGQGKYADAAKIGVRVRDIRELVLGKAHPEFAGSLNNLATLYRSMGVPSRAEPLYKQAIAIEKLVLGELHPQHAITLNNLGSVYQSMGAPARAEPLYRQALGIQRVVLGEQDRHYAASLNNLAGLYVEIGDHARAEPLYEQAIEIDRAVFGERHPSYATSLNNLAGLYRRMGDYARAEPLCRETLQIIKLTLGERHPHYASSLNNLAMVYTRLGEYTRAEPLYRQALDIRKTVLGEQHPDYAISLNNLAALYVSRGDYARAEPLYMQTIELDRSALGERHPSYALSVNNLAGLYRRMGDYAGAERLSREAAEIIRDALEGSSPTQSERQQKRHQSSNRHFLDGQLSVAGESGVTTVDALHALWRWKGAVTLRQQAYRRIASNPELAPLFSSLRTVSAQLSALSGRVPRPPRQDAPRRARAAWLEQRKRWDSEFSRLRRDREDLEQKIAAGSGEFRALRDPMTATSMQELLPPKSAFVDFLEYRQMTHVEGRLGMAKEERHYIAFVVRPDRDPRMQRLGDVQSLAESITAFRQPLLSRHGDRAASRKAAARLRENLWLPLEQHLDGVETIIVSPDTALGALPFAALPGESADSYLIEQYRFAAVPLAAMARALVDEARRPAPEKGLLVIGDVAYGSPTEATPNGPSSDGRPSWMRAPTRGGRWGPLPAAGDELASVQRTFRKSFQDATVTTLDASLATEEAFMKHAPRHYNLHVVTHGFFAGPEVKAIGAMNASGSLGRTSIGRDPAINRYLPGLLSGIVLAGANNPPTEDSPHADGILTASEIETLDLNAVDLVVLSACDTGLGKTAGGEGLTGLQRAFHIAGAKSVVASLWEVPDRATQELMSRFYRYYWQEGRSKIDSLRQAQLDLLNNRELARGVGGTVGELRDREQPAVDGDPKTQRTDPRYWAAFVLSGDWR